MKAMNSRTMSNMQRMALNKRVSVNKKSDKHFDMPLHYVPTNADVICGKGKTCFEHEGNIQFRNLVGRHLKRYSAATAKIEKSSIVSEIIESIRLSGTFVKKKADGSWFAVSNHLAREKVGQTIRDMLHLQYKSSTKAKKKRRELEQAKANANMNRITRTHLEISQKIETLKEEVKNADNDMELSDMFTNANLEILKSLNRLRASQQAENPNGPDAAAAAAALNGGGAPLPTTLTPSISSELSPPPLLANTVTPELMLPSERLMRHQSSDSVLPLQQQLSRQVSGGSCSNGFPNHTTSLIRSDSSHSYFATAGGAAGAGHPQQQQQQQQQGLQDLYAELLRQQENDNRLAMSRQFNAAI